MIEIPLLILYLGTVTQLHNGSQIWHETRALIPGLLVGVAWAVLLGGLGLLFASFSGRRAYATGAVAIFFFLTLTLSRVLIQIGQQGGGGQGLAKTAGLISPFTVLDGVRQWLGGTSPGHRARARWRRGAVRADVRGVPGGRRRRPDRPVPEGWCGMTGIEPGGVELDQVSRWYGNVVAVNDVTLTVGPGVTGLLGPNGAGKSTILHMIAGLLPPSRGDRDRARRAELAQHPAAQQGRPGP